MLYPSLHRSDGVPGIALVPASIEIFGHRPKLHDQVLGKIFRLKFGTFLPPESRRSSLLPIMTRASNPPTKYIRSFNIHVSIFIICNRIYYVIEIFGIVRFLRRGQHRFMITSAQCRAAPGSVGLESTGPREDVRSWNSGHSPAGKRNKSSSPIDPGSYPPSF